MTAWVSEALVAAAITAAVGVAVAALSFVECGSALGALLTAVPAGLGHPSAVEPQIAQEEVSP
jgi:hypothetical protein